ncbi:MAG TPA: response regulator transcription factor [Thermoanaerobaculia bacterium]|nr:response regulator transcription factor [Thermoanaerobaculia bacterium]
MIRVLLVDDHVIVREGVRALLEDEGFEVVGEAGSGDEAVERVRSLAPDVVLMDLVMPGLPATEAIRLIRESCPGTQVLVLTTFLDDRQVREAVEAGAIGYLLKDVLKGDLARAIRDARQGRPWLHPEAQRSLMQRISSRPVPAPHESLTPRERSVLELIGRGRSNKQIAAALHLSEGTVKGYTSVIFDKLAVADRTQAALYAVKHGLV